MGGWGVAVRGTKRKVEREAVEKAGIKVDVDKIPYSERKVYEGIVESKREEKDDPD